MNGIHEDEPSSTVLDGWFEDYRADVLVVGHTHAPLARRADSGALVLNPGTLMREAKYAPDVSLVFDRGTGKFVRREPELGTFGVFDTATRELRIVRTAGNGDPARRLPVWTRDASLRRRGFFGPSARRTPRRRSARGGCRGCAPPLRRACARRAR